MQKLLTKTKANIVVVPLHIFCYVTCKEIGQAFVNIIKPMVYSSFSGKCASKGVCLISICTYLTTCSVTFSLSY